jgi:hypothetical protein
VQKNDQATWKFPGHVLWVTAVKLKTCTEDSLKLYKIEFALELIKWFLNGRLVKIRLFFRNLHKKTSPVQKMTKPCGNILDMFLGLGRLNLRHVKETLRSCTKLYLQRN